MVVKKITDDIEWGFAVFIPFDEVVEVCWRPVRFKESFIYKPVSFFKSKSFQYKRRWGEIARVLNPVDLYGIDHVCSVIDNKYLRSLTALEELIYRTENESKS